MPDRALDLVRACQRRAPAHLGGGAALSGAYLAHRLSRDLDLVCHEAEDVRSLVRALPVIATECGVKVELVRDAGTFVRSRVDLGGRDLELDIVYEATPDIESAPPLEGVTIESLADLRAAKITCLLSRSEPRDLVDLLMLDRAGYAPERDLELALRKDSGLDPGVLAWLLKQFPTHPLPSMLVPLTETELLRFRDDLAERFHQVAVPSDPP